jgi:hypothetical protein
LVVHSAPLAKTTWMAASSLLVTSIRAVVGRPLTSLTPRMSESGNVVLMSALSEAGGWLASLARKSASDCAKHEFLCHSIDLMAHHCER